jgi:DNA-binding PadR family transcriptional regulator
MVEGPLFTPIMELNHLAVERRVNLILEAVKLAEKDLDMVLDERKLRFLSALAAAGSLQRKNLAEYAGFDPRDGVFEYHLRKLIADQIIRKAQNGNGSTIYELTPIGRQKVKGLIGFLKYIITTKLEDSSYVSYREQLISINKVIRDVEKRLLDAGLIKISGNITIPVNQFRKSSLSRIQRRMA